MYGKSFFLGLLSLVLLSCAHEPKGNFESPAFKAYRQEVLQEITSEQARNPAMEPTAAKTLGLSFKEWQQKNNTFEVYVFPKVTNQTSKYVDTNDAYIARPEKFTVSLKLQNPCAAFFPTASKPGLGQALYKAHTVFSTELSKSAKNCAIVEVTSETVKAMTSSLRRKGDILSYTLYLDEDYELAGYLLKTYSSSNKTKSVLVKNSTAEPSSSGLSLFPIDLPRADAKRSATQFSKQNVPQLDELSLNQIRRLNKGFSFPSCTTAQAFAYRDYFSNEVKSVWCASAPWPQYIENKRFIAITPNFKL